MAGTLEDFEGPVTIMFTDIEGSTALRTTLGDADADALFREHDELIRQQIEEHQGHDQQAALGDGFLAVFVSTRRAHRLRRSASSGRSTRSTGAAPAPPLQVRIGLNTGEVAWQGGQLVRRGGARRRPGVRPRPAAADPRLRRHPPARRHRSPTSRSATPASIELKGFPQPWRLWEVVWVRETTAGSAAGVRRA